MGIMGEGEGVQKATYRKDGGKTFCSGAHQPIWMGSGRELVWELGVLAGLILAGEGSR